MLISVLEDTFENAVRRSFPDSEVNFKIDFSVPNNPDHGDLSTNICMQLSKRVGLTAKDIARRLLDFIDYDKNLIKSVEIAGTGFINIKLTNLYFHKLLEGILSEKDDFGKTYSNKGKRVNVEYVSANPTGMLHLGHGRNAAIGDTLSNLYEWTGWDVTREYYFNNAGNQMKTLAKSIYARMAQLTSMQTVDFPDDGYHGHYIITIAEELLSRTGSDLLTGSSEDMETIMKFGMN